MATTLTTSNWKSPSYSHSSSRSARPSTTPKALHPVMSVGQPRPPQVSPSAIRIPGKGGSPSYFGFDTAGETIDADSGRDYHSQQNWDQSSNQPWSGRQHHTSPTANPEFELFRRQSEKDNGFSLHTLTTPSIWSDSSTPNRPTEPLSSPKYFQDLRAPAGGFFKPEANPFFQNTKSTRSSSSRNPAQSDASSQKINLTLPASQPKIQQSLPSTTKKPGTLPDQDKDIAQMLAPFEVAQIIQKASAKTVILDLRVYQQFATSRIKGALSLCIPSTLIKRPAYTVQKLGETFTSEATRAEFAKWKTAEYIVVYDATSSQAKEAIIPLNVLKKFLTEGWKGKGIVVKGGFAKFAEVIPALIVKGTSEASSSKPDHQKLPVAGGCVMPKTENAANPFFSNIRQNMDLVDGVGQIPISKPENMTGAEEKSLPAWLRRAASTSDEGKAVSDKFLRIERSEQARMKKALSSEVTYGTPGARSDQDVQIAGIEKGSKNRYNNIFPFEHSRVKLQNLSAESCDYVNASHVQARYSNRKYIATQAPIPQTFADFWNVVWQQKARVIVMLTAESEGGQVKGHAYWKKGVYGDIKLDAVLEQKVALQHKSSKGSTARPSLGPRRSTTNSMPNSVDEHTLRKTSSSIDEPFVIVRSMSISHSAYPNKGARDIVQIQYTQWPDFGAPASPTSVVALINLVDKVQKNACTPSRDGAEVPYGQRPIVVHCSAGCGRTGTFCTIDSVIDMLKRQKRARAHRALSEMDVDSEDDWVDRDDIDLVAKAVDDFRHQRLSMVQNLRQFALCYESVLQWLHDEHGGGT